jgi:hypothetical protein
MSNWAGNTIIIKHEDSEVMSSVWNHILNFRSNSDVATRCYCFGSKHWIGTINKTIQETCEMIEILYETKHGGDDEVGERLVNELKLINEGINVEMHFELYGYHYLGISGNVSNPTIKILENY